MTSCRLEGLLLGAFIAMASESSRDWARVVRAAPTVFAGSLFTFLGMWMGLRDIRPFRDARLDQSVLIDSTAVLTVGILAASFCFASLLVIILESPEKSCLRGFLEARPLRLIGKYSYAMYVFHGLVIIGTMHVIECHLPRIAKLPGAPGEVMIILWVSAVSYALAWLSWHLLEKHFLRLKKHFGYEKNAKLLG
jgi:peptidoglycan/LPS O-acetylase OafA/YrhL